MSLYALFYFCFPFVPWKIEKLHFRNSKMKEVFRNLVRLFLAPADKKGVSLRTQPLSPTTYRESGVSRWRQPTKKVCPLGHNRSPRRPLGRRGFPPQFFFLSAPPCGVPKKKNGGPQRPPMRSECTPLVGVPTNARSPMFVRTVPNETTVTVAPMYCRGFCWR